MSKRTATTTALAAAAGFALLTPAAANAATLPTVHPVIALHDASCSQTGPGEWAVTVRWTATKGRYTDLGTYGRRTRVAVTPTATRVFASTVVVSGWQGMTGTPAPPESVTAAYAELVAPAGWNGDPRRESTWHGTRLTVPVSCA